MEGGNGLQKSVLLIANLYAVVYKYTIHGMWPQINVIQINNNKRNLIKAINKMVIIKKYLLGIHLLHKLHQKSVSVLLFFFYPHWYAWKN